MPGHVTSKTPPLVVVVGQTATGKSALALALAEHFKGEIIAADSRTVYKGMDIGTAKPSTAERHRITHFCIDIATPGRQFTVADFKCCAQSAIDEITSKKKLPIMVGGTGLYIDALLYNFTFRKMPDPESRTSLEGLSLEELKKKIADADLPMPRNASNPRHLRRVLESGSAPSQQRKLRPNTLILGLSAQREILHERITLRVEQMVADGFIDEVTGLLSRYGNVESLRAPGYKAFARYVSREITLEEAKTLFIRNDLQLAKRQMTWFKRNKSIHWLTAGNQPGEAIQLVTAFLDTTKS